MVSKSQYRKCNGYQYWLSVNDFDVTKFFISVPQLNFSFLVVHVAEQMDCNDPSYLEALERETFILQKRVNACKSRIMVITVFDITS